MIKVSVVIPTYNHYHFLLKTLNSLNKQSYHDFEVVVSDDGSTDETSKVSSQKYQFPLKYVYQKNSGRAAARNLGASHAAGDIIVFIDDHIFLSSDFIFQHCHSHDKYYGTDIAIVRGGVGYVADELEIASTPIVAKLKGEGNPFVSFITNNISLRKKVFLLSGGFDEDFKEYGFQDSELGYRLRKLGFKIKYNHLAAGYIFSVNNSIEKRLDRFRQAGRSAVLFSKKHRWGSLLLGAHWVNLGKLSFLVFFGFPAKYRERMTRDNKYFFKLRHFYFLEGIKDGFTEYKHSTFKMKRAEKIVFIVLHRLDLSGAPISSILLANNLDGYLPVIVSPAVGIVSKRLNLNKVELRVLPSFAKRLFLKRLIAKFQPEIIHANTFLTRYALGLGGIKSVAHVREDLSNYPHIATSIYKKADKVIVVSNGMKSYFPKDVARKITVIYNAMEALPKKITVAEENFILFVGSIEQRKGLRYLLEATKDLDTKVIVLGKVLEKSYFKKCLDISERATFFAPQNDLDDYYRKASLVVVPSLSEPFGRVVLEALAYGKIVIGSNVGGIPEIIEDGISGVLVPPANSGILREAITQVLALPEQKKNRLRQAAYKRAQQFMPEKHVAEITNVYRKLR